MVKRSEYDFLTWTGFPSSAKLTNDEAGQAAWWGINPPVSVAPGSKLNVSFKAKSENVLYAPRGGVDIHKLEGGVWKWLDAVPIPYGTYDWREFAREITVPSGVTVLRFAPYGGPGTTEEKGITWYDDLKVFQDGVLIYANDFSKWDPVIGAGIGAPIGGVAGYLLKEPLGPMVSEVVGAVVGGALGGGVGLLTGLGIIPVPQIPIPTFGATPEEPGAPARLGKYRITD